MAEHDVEQVWEEFWAPFCQDENGNVDLDQIKRELYDYRRWMTTWAEVASEFSGGRLSKVNYTPDVYLSAFEEEFRRQLEEYLEEDREVRQITADEDRWQQGYNEGWADGVDWGREKGLEDARNAIW